MTGGTAQVTRACHGHRGTRGIPTKVLLPVPCCFASADIDECAQGAPCPGNTTCTNTVGSYDCSCPAGEEGKYGHCSHPHYPWASVEDGSHGTQTEREQGELAELCTQALAVFNRRNWNLATAHAPRLQVSVFLWEGKIFPCNFSLWKKKKKRKSHPIKVQMHMQRLGGIK